VKSVSLEHFALVRPPAARNARSGLQAESHERGSDHETVSP
jgi:hypothetical protein